MLAVKTNPSFSEIRDVHVDQLITEFIRTYQECTTRGCSWASDPNTMCVASRTAEWPLYAAIKRFHGYDNSVIRQFLKTLDDAANLANEISEGCEAARSIRGRKERLIACMRQLGQQY